MCVCNPPLNPDLLPSWHFNALESMLRNVICSSHLILMRKKSNETVTKPQLGCKYLKTCDANSIIKMKVYSLLHSTCIEHTENRQRQFKFRIEL